MLSVFVKSSFFYVSHLVAFSWIGLPLLVRQFGERQIGVIPVMAMLIPVWVSSTVLFSEKDESYAFLRSLPMTDREVVRTKFTLAALAVLAYWLLMTAVTVQFCTGTPYLAPNMALMEIAALVSLVAAACWFMGIWMFGRSIMTFVILIFMVLGIAGALLFRFGNGSDLWCSAYDVIFVSLLSKAPWYVDGLVIVLGLLVYYALMQLAVKVKRASEPHS
jgi:hypothetical protein